MDFSGNLLITESDAGYVRQIQFLRSGRDVRSHPFPNLRHACRFNISGINFRRPSMNRRRRRGEAKFSGKGCRADGASASGKR